MTCLKLSCEIFGIEVDCCIQETPVRPLVVSEESSQLIDVHDFATLMWPPNVLPLTCGVRVNDSIAREGCA